MIKELFQLNTEKKNNYIQFKENGQFIKKSFAEVFRDVSKISRILENEFSDTLIMGKPCYEWVVVGLAVIRNGGKIISFPESTPEEDIATNLQGLSFNLAVVEDNNEAFFKQTYNSKTYTFDSIRKIILSNSEELDERVPEPKEFSIIAFSSGTTSTKTIKSFEIFPDRIENHIQGYVNSFHITSDDTWFVCHSFSHIVHFEYVLGGFIYGYNICIGDSLDIILRPLQINPSVLVTVPGVYESILQQVQRKYNKHEEFRDLQELGLVYNHQTKEFNNVRKEISAKFPDATKYLGEKIKVMIIGAAPSQFDLKKNLVLLGYPIYEAYGMTEVGMISCNTPNENKLGTVGKKFNGIKDLDFTEGVLKVTTEFRITRGYLNLSHSENATIFPETNTIITGDLAEIDEDHYLKITGRTKEIIVTKSGKNINPRPIEEKLESIESVRHAMIFGDNQSDLVALLFMKEKDEALEDEIIAINSHIPVHEQIVAYKPIYDIPDIKNGLVTRTSKLIRQAVKNRYASEIEDLYSTITQV